MSASSASLPFSWLPPILPIMLAGAVRRPGSRSMGKPASNPVSAAADWPPHRRHGGRGVICPAKHQRAPLWFVGAYAALFARWSVVSVRAVPIAGVGPRQFAIIAEEELPQQTIIHELTGLLSSDPADGASHSNLSVMQDLDGVQRVLFGPIRLVNHCCAPNARFDFAQHGNGHTVTVRTNNKIIRRWEEITVSYGPGFCADVDAAIASLAAHGAQGVNSRCDADVASERHV
ncbi:hypothetical protein B0H14DRAFT_2597555 [Mycena olivaceomarginata]|nr:hypothetical protein B0H14DRAFT_2597555 [Mycena olivaceomarginata]